MTRGLLAIGALGVWGCVGFSVLVLIATASGYLTAGDAPLSWRERAGVALFALACVALGGLVLWATGLSVGQP